MAFGVKINDIMSAQSWPIFAPKNCTGDWIELPNFSGNQFAVIAGALKNFRGLCGGPAEQNVKRFGIK